MKDDRIKEVFANIDTDISMDQRITDQLMNYQSITNISNMKARFLITNHTVTSFARMAAIIVLVIFCGTTTVLAGNYLIMSYKANFEVIPETELGPPLEYSVKQRYGTGHKNESRITRDSEGNIIEAHIPEDPNHDDIKYGDEVFSKLGLPNLIPTYLYDNYLLGEGGYLYTEITLEDGSISSQISASFFSINASKNIYVYFTPSKAPIKNKTITYMTGLTEEDYITSTYVTRGGLICNLVENPKYDIIDAAILFDSEQLGNASYFLDFVWVPMDEVKAILDSIPITVEE